MANQNVPYIVNLGRGATLRLPHAVISTGAAGATIRFGSFDRMVELQPVAVEARVVPAPARPAPPPARGAEGAANAPRRPAPDRAPDNHNVRSELQGRRRRPNVVTPNEARRPASEGKRKEMPAASTSPCRVSVFSRLEHGKRVATRTNAETPRPSAAGSTARMPASQIAVFAPGTHDAEASSSRRRSRRQMKKVATRRMSVPTAAPLATDNPFEPLNLVKRNSSTADIKASAVAAMKSQRRPSGGKPRETVPRQHQRRQASSARGACMKEGGAEAGQHDKYRASTQKPKTLATERWIEVSRHNRRVPRHGNSHRYSDTCQRREVLREETSGNRRPRGDRNPVPLHGNRRPHGDHEPIITSGNRRPHGDRTPDHPNGNRRRHGDRAMVPKGSPLRWAPKPHQRSAVQLRIEEPRAEGATRTSPSRERSPCEVLPRDAQKGKGKEKVPELFFEMPRSPVVHWRRRSDKRPPATPEKSSGGSPGRQPTPDSDDVEFWSIRVVTRSGIGGDAGGDGIVQPNADGDGHQGQTGNSAEGPLTDQQRMEQRIEDQDREILYLAQKFQEMNTTLGTIVGQLADIKNAMSGRREGPNAEFIPGNGETSRGGGRRERPLTPPAGRDTTQNGETSAVSTVTKAQVEEMIAQRVQEAIAAEHGDKFVSKGRPYPPEYDLVQYPPGYSVPKFNTFTGAGNPRQHLAQFKAACGNTGGNDALLMKQFVSSLGGPAFDWYADLPNDSVHAFAEMEALFTKRFSGVTERVTIADLAAERKKKDESESKFIQRWRNLAMKCEQQLEEEHAVQLLLGNIDERMAPYLAMASITTFQDLLDRVAKFERLSLPRTDAPTSDRSRRTGPKATEPRKAEVHVVDKGKKVEAPSQPNKMTLGGDARPPRVSVKDRLNKEYPFREDRVPRLFQQTLKAGLFRLPEIRRPEQANLTERADYCPYHRFLGHSIEKCYVFKDLLEDMLNTGKFKLAEVAAVKRPTEGVNIVQLAPPEDGSPRLRSARAKELAGIIKRLTSPVIESCRVISYVEDTEEEFLFPQWGGDDGRSARAAPDTDELCFGESTDEEGDQPAVTRGRVNHLRSGRELPPPIRPRGRPPHNQERGKHVEGAIEVEAIPSTSAASPPNALDYNVLAHLRKIPAQLSVLDALMMSKELRETLIKALKEPEQFQAYFAELSLLEAPDTHRVIKVTFSDDDLQVGAARHNRPLYVTAEVNGKWMNRIMIDHGASVSLMNLQTLRWLALDVRHLKNEEAILQGFDEQGQRALGSVVLTLKMGGLITETKFYIIDSNTSYRALLGRPWLHEYDVLPSTKHQCMKYYRDGVEYTIPADPQPFTVHDVGCLTDARYYSVAQQAREVLSSVPEPAQPGRGAALQPRRDAFQRNPGKARPPGIYAAVPPPHSSPANSSNIPCFGSDSDEEGSVGGGDYKEDPSVLVLGDGSDGESHFDEAEIAEACALSMRGLTFCEDVLEVTLVPPEHHKALPPANVCAVEDLKTIYIAPRAGRQERGIMFYRSEHTYPTPRRALGIADDEIGEEEVFIPPYYSRPLIALARQQGIALTQTLERASLFRRMWEREAPEESNTWGLGYVPPTRFKRPAKKRKGLGFPPPSCNICVCSIVNDNEASDSAADFLYAPESYTCDDNLEFKTAPKELEDGTHATVDELREVNLGTEEEPRPTYVSALLSEEMTEELKTLLRQYRDCFAWNYNEMPGLAPEVAVHRLAIDPEAVPVKQPARRMRLEIEEQVVAETRKLIEAGFIREEKYAHWIANVVPVRKKNGQIRVCIDFRDLNKACPKDDFPLPVTELMIDNTSTHDMFSFMDGSSGYNQIKMAPEDEKHTSFRTPIGIYCYKVMPFGLKNAGATYQRAMTSIFNDLIHKKVECYVDDLVVKSLAKTEHFADLKVVFERIRQYNLKMNPLKCAFGVSSGKFLGFIVRHRGIEVDPAKIQAIAEMPPPRNLRQLRSLQGKLAYIRRFISNLSGRCQPFSKLMKKDSPFIWDKACQAAFEDIKSYLTNPPILAAPIPGKPLILYTAALDESLGALLAQNNEHGRENALYYVSRRLVGAETRYSYVEKQCLAVVFAAQKLRHYMLAHKVTLISREDPIKFLITKPTLTGRLARWAVLLMQFDITFVSRKAMKGQILADFLAAHPLPADAPQDDRLPDEEIMNTRDRPRLTWKLYFDGASSIRVPLTPGIPVVRAGIGLVFVTPEGGILRHSFSLTEPRTNNEAEYEALVAGLEIAVSMEIPALRVYGDSQLVISQVLGDFKINKLELAYYHKRVLELIRQIPEVTLSKVPRAENGGADVLAKLAKEMAGTGEGSVSITVQTRHVLEPAMLYGTEEPPEEALMVETIVQDWRCNLIEYLKKGKLPDEASLAVQVKKRALQYALVDDTLYRRAFDQMWLRCLGQTEAGKVLKEVHGGLCGAHQAGPKMKIKIKRIGYFWPSMAQDCVNYARKCHNCQVHGNFIHQAPHALHPTVASWPFDNWGTDIIGPIDPPSTKGHRFILAATDYFSKWAEAVPLKEVTADHVVKFFRDHVVHRFGVPRRVISDNGTAFKSIKVTRFAEKYKIDWRFSSIYNPRANGLAEAFNKTLVKIMKKTLSKNKREWHERMSEALWAYRTTYKTATKATPYFLAFGAEAVLPLEVELPSLRVALYEGLTHEDNARLRLEELEAVEGERLHALQRLENYQARMTESFNRMVRPRAFRVGELVLVLKRPIIPHRRIGGKFEPTWEGPYVIEKAYNGGAYQLIGHEGDRPMPPINGRYLKKYYA